MPLILGHVRLDLGQFPHLVPQRLRVAARELRAAAPALGRPERLHVVTLVGGNQGPLVFLVAGLPAAFLLRLAFRRLRPGVRMLRAGRQRGVLRRLAFPCRSSSSIRASNSAIFASNRRMMAWASGGWRAMISSVITRRHATVVARTPPSVSRSVFLEKHLRAVNGYLPFNQILARSATRPHHVTSDGIGPQLSRIL